MQITVFYREENICPICCKFYIFRCINCYKTKNCTGVVSNQARKNFYYKMKNAFYLIILNLFNYANKFLKLNRQRQTQLSIAEDNQVIEKENFDFEKQLFLSKYIQFVKANMNSDQHKIINTDIVAYIVTLKASVEENVNNELESKSKTSISTVSSSPRSDGQIQASTSLKPKKTNYFMKAFKRKKKQKSVESSIPVSSAIKAISSLEIDMQAPKILKNQNEDKNLEVVSFTNQIPFIESISKQQQEMIISANPFVTDVAVNTDPEIQSTNLTKSQSFLCKLISRQVNRLNTEQKLKIQESGNARGSNFLSNSETFIDEYCFDDSNSIMYKPETNTEREHDNTIFATSFIKNCNSALKLNLLDGLNEITQFSVRLHENEKHLIQLLHKYIQDDNVEKQLVQKLSYHSKDYMEVEKRTQDLVKEMWQQQTEVHHSRERVLQDMLNSLVKQNRSLQNDYETLMRKNEQLRSETYFTTSSHHVDFVSQLKENNERLQCKLNIFIKQIGDLEEEMQIFQNNNISLENQVRHLGIQLEKYKTGLENIERDYDLQKTSFTYKLQSSELKLQKNSEASNILLEDLECLKEQMKSFSFNWNKFKPKENDITDVIYTCRIFINDLARELLMSQSQAQLLRKDNESLRENNTRLQENLQRSATELDRIDKKLEKCRIYEQEIDEHKTKNLNLEQIVQEFKNKMENMNQQFEIEKSLLKSSQEELYKQIDTKNKEVEEKQSVINNCKSENEVLRLQVETLNQAFMSTGAGDVAREISLTQEKIAFFQNQCCQLISEKNYLTEKLSQFNLERETLIEYQNTYYQHLQNQQRDVDILHRENHLLTEQLEMNRATITALQTDRVKHLEEINILRAIYQQMKSEIDKVEQLEGTVANMNKETSRLAIIAEYNKRLGDRLKEEVEERDQTITKLQNSVEVLNSIQAENAKDKVALCAELTEVCACKNQLTDTLTMEIQKNTNLDESKKELENEKNFQLKAIQDMQRKERAALKELLKDFKNVVTQRNQLLIEQDEAIQQITELRKNITDHQKSCNLAASKCNEKDLRIADLEKQVRDKITALETVARNSENNSEEYENALQHLYCCTEQLKKEKENLENTVKYLQNTTQKLHYDLNEARKEEKEAKDELNKIRQENELLQQSLNEQTVAVKTKVKENEEIKEEAEKLTKLCNNLAIEYEEHVADSASNEEQLRNHLENSKETLNHSTEELKTLLTVLNEKDDEVCYWQDRYRELSELHEYLQEALSNIEDQTNFLSQNTEIQSKLQENLQELERKHHFYATQIDELTQEFEDLQNKFSITLEAHEEENEMCTIRLQEITEDYQTHTKTVKENLRTLTAKLNDILQNFETEKTSHQKLVSDHKVLASKLLKAVRMLVDEKLSRQNAEAKTSELSQKCIRIKSEKEGLQQKNEILTVELQDLRKRNDDLSNDKQIIQVTLIETQEAYKDMICQCQDLEKEMKDIKKICKDKIHQKATCEIPDYIDIQAQCKYQALEQQIEQLKAELNESHNTIISIKKEICKLEQELTTLEFQKCELSLRLHETQGKLNTESELYEKLLIFHQEFLTNVLQLREDGAISRKNCDYLLNLIRNHADINKNSEHNLTNKEYESCLSACEM